jgi:RHS repeat-associated protein
MSLRFIGVAAIGFCTAVAFAASTGRSPQKVDLRTSHSAEGVAGIAGQTDTLLPDGRLLLVGGLKAQAPINSSIIEDTRTGALIETAGQLLHARAFHSATVLPTGNVLILGGVGDDGSVLSQTELFDTSRQIFQDVAVAGFVPRAHHTATLLTDGRVLIAGGIDSQGRTLSSIELLDYRSGQVSTLIANLRTPRSGHTANLLPDGTVLVWGGQDGNGATINDGEIIDPDAPSVRLVSRFPDVQDSAPGLVASIPQNGETGIALNSLIALRFSKALDVLSLNNKSITLQNSAGEIPIIVVPAEEGMLAFITPQVGLEYGNTYTIHVSGVVDRSGSALPESTILFTTAIAEETGSIGSESGSTVTGSPETTDQGAAQTAVPPLDSKWRKMRPLAAAPGVTALAGQVLALDGSPVPNVLVELDSQSAITDNTGRFLVQNVGSGHHVMLVDGGPASTKSATYGIFRVGVDLKAGQTNSLNYTFWMPALDTEHVVSIPSPTTKDVVITNPTIPGLELHIPAGTEIHDARGRTVTQIGITPIPMNQPPFPLKRGVQFPTYFTIQPGGATFTASGRQWSPAETNRAKGARIYYKNYLNAKPGARYAFWNYDPAQKGWYVYGHGRVSSDAKTIEPEEGTQIWSFDGAMVGQPGNAPAVSPKPGNPQCCDPADLQSGLFVYRKTDLELNDTIPLVLRRTYRQDDSVSRDFGIGMNMDYDMFMVGDDEYTPEGYTYQDLILADGGRVHFTRTSPCLGTNGYCDFTNAVYVATSTGTDYYGATLSWVLSAGGSSGYWTLRKKDGTTILFPDSTDSTDPRQAAPTSMTDRYGNTLTFTRDVFSRLTQIASPNGRWIAFTYDSTVTNRIVGAQDNTGRTTSYTYNPAGYLATATDVNGGVTQYTYDTNGNMVSIQDPKGIVYLQNSYDANNMVSTQIGPDGGTYTLSYTLDTNGNVTQTTVKDPRGYIRQVTFNSSGFMTSDIRALGMPEQQTTTYNRQQGTGLLLSATDTLNRTTTYTYDEMGDVTSITQLAGTSNAATTTLAYTPEYFQISAVTDPLGNTNAFTYDGVGNLLSATDPLGNASTYTYNTAGQPITATDALGNQTQFTYNAGDLVSVTDPLGRTTSRFVDAAGRVASTTDPLGHVSRIAYDPADNVTSVTDALGNQTSFTYDGNGNLLTLTDAKQNSTTWSYNNIDKVQTRQDALGNQASFQYDLNGNLIQVTDRKGQVTKYTYDGINRLTLVTFNDGSTVTNTFDGGNRLTNIVDSASGSIARNLDGLDNLLSEATPQGTVSYTYRADGRRQTMTVPGQPEISYGYDNAGHLTSISQGSTGVYFGYDGDGRRTSLTLPNGITAAYSYDAAAQLTRIAYQGSALGLADLEYSYDLAGRRVGVSGSLASEQLPAAVTSAQYNANNQLTQWNGVSMSYDLNGNTLSDGTNSYTWDVRNRLASANSGGAAFSYDPLGRRMSHTLLSTTTSYLYDGANAVQERVGGSVTANMLTGGVDEHFQRTDGTGSYSYLADALGSTVALMDANGNPVDQYSYGPYGLLSATGSNANPYTYTGRESDGLGIDYYRARYYNPQTGRFISEDPTGLAGGINLYAYAGDNPLDFRDPFGLDKQKPTPQACFGGFSMPDGSCVGMDKNKQQQCTAAQQTAAQLATLFDNASTESGWLAFGSGVGTAASGAGEGITFGGDTPVTITFASLTAFFGTTSAVTSLAAGTLNAFAQGNTTALQNFVWSSLVNLATTAAASKIPGMERWAATLGDLASKAFDVTHNAEEACHQ